MCYCFFVVMKLGTIIQFRDISSFKFADSRERNSKARNLNIMKHNNL